MRPACFDGKNPEALIFDLDGTLADSAPDIHRSLNLVLERSGLPALELDAVTRMIGGGPEVLVRKALGALSLVANRDDIKQLTASFQHTYVERGNGLTTLFRGVMDCLDHLARHKVPIGLCSNKPEPACRQLLHDLEIASYFDAIQGSGTGLPTKPHPAALQAVMRRLGAEPERALYVGDSKTDVETARAAGVPIALVECGYTAAPATTLGADWVVANLSEVPSIWQ